jgi:hypothetical protein
VRRRYVQCANKAEFEKKAARARCRNQTGMSEQQAGLTINERAMSRYEMRAVCFQGSCAKFDRHFHVSVRPPSMVPTALPAAACSA